MLTRGPRRLLPEQPRRNAALSSAARAKRPPQPPKINSIRNPSPANSRTAKRQAAVPLAIPILAVQRHNCITEYLSKPRIPPQKNKNGPSRKRGRNRNIEAALARRGITSSCLRWSSWLPWERQSWSQPWEHLPWRSSSRLPRWHPPRRRSSWPRACANDGSWAWPPR